MSHVSHVPRVPLEARSALPSQVVPLRPGTAAVLADCKRRIEESFERGFRRGALVDLKAALPTLPLLVRCAVRVHEKREARGVLLFGLDVAAPDGGVERRSVLVAPGQQLVLLFSRRGVLDAAGDLVPNPSAPVASGTRWTRIDWAADVNLRDWY